MAYVNLGAHRLVKHDVISLCGAKGSGKDSFFNFWTSKPIYPTRNVKFADALNTIINEILQEPVSYDQRDVPLKIETAQLEAVVSKYVTPSALQFINVATPEFHMSWRELAEWLGTNVIRRIDPDYFVRAAQEEVSKHTANKDVSFLTDTRFDNELALSTMAVLFKRESDTRLEFDSGTHEAEKLGEFISVWSNRALVCRDLGKEHLVQYCVGKIKDYFLERGNAVHAMYQTMLDADGELMFIPVLEAYRCFEFDKDLEDVEWFGGE